MVLHCFRDNLAGIVHNLTVNHVLHLLSKDERNLAEKSRVGFTQPFRQGFDPSRAVAHLSTNMAGGTDANSLRVASDTTAGAAPLLLGSLDVVAHPRLLLTASLHLSSLNQ